jgi:hypothetical protein
MENILNQSIKSRLIQPCLFCLGQVTAEERFVGHLSRGDELI